MIRRKIQAILLDRKLNAERQATKNLNIALQDKEFKSLYQKQKELEIQSARELAYNRTANLTALKEIIALQDERLKVLKISRESLQPKYVCKNCSDTGNHNGKPCACTNAIKSNLLLKESGINFIPHTFEDCNYEIFDNSQKIKEFYEKMQKYCQKSQKNVLISGNTGVGKTFLLECMLSELIKNNKFTFYATAFKMSEDMLKYHTTFDATKSKFLEPYLSSDVLIIDDLGTEPTLKNVSEEYLYLILNQRLFERKPFIISTNLSPIELQEKYGERIFSRLVNKEKTILYRIENQDLRLKR